MDFQKLPNGSIPKVDYSKLQQKEYFGISLVVPPEVYGPMEDTDLAIRFLRDWIQNFIESPRSKDFKEKTNPLRILEMGSGSGVLSLYVISRLTRENIEIYHAGIDINPIAVETAEYNSNLNHYQSITNFYRGDLFSPLTTNLQRQPYDLIIFNPPYLASESNIINSTNRKWIDLSWEGGEHGNEVTLEFLHQLSPFLSPHGEFFYITSSHVEQSQIREMLSSLHLKIQKRYEKKVFFETIWLYHCKKE